MFIVKSVCYKCGTPVVRRYPPSHKAPKKLFCSKHIHGKDNPNLGGGWIASGGYVAIMVDGKRMLQHRAIIERHIGRKLNDSEIVHHINGIKTDNRIENLVVMQKRDHPTKTLVPILQARIRKLEEEIEHLTIGVNKDEDT